MIITVKQSIWLQHIIIKNNGVNYLPRPKVKINKYADVFSEFLQKLQIEDAIYIGHSYGGRILINLAVRKQLEAEKLILVDASGVGINEGTINIKKIVSKIVKPIFKIPALQGLRMKIYQSMGAEDYIVSQDSPFFKATYLNILKDKYNQLLNNIKIPTYLIWGENDKDTPIEMALTMEQDIQGSKLEFILDAGHFPFLENPKEFEKVLLNFLEN